MDIAVQKKGKKDSSYILNETAFFHTPRNTEKSALRLLVSQKIVMNLSKDIEKMTELMVSSIWEGMINDRR